MTRKSNNKKIMNEGNLSSEAQEVLQASRNRLDKAASQKKDDKNQSNAKSKRASSKGKETKEANPKSSKPKSNKKDSGKRNNDKGVPKEPDYSEYLKMVKTHPYGYAVTMHIQGLDSLPLTNRTVERVIWKKKVVTDPMRVALASWAEINRQNYPQYYTFFVLSLIHHTVEGMIKMGADAYLEWAKTGKITNNAYYSLLPGIIGKPLKELTTCLCYAKRLSCADADQACVDEFLQLQTALKHKVTKVDDPCPENPNRKSSGSRDVNRDNMFISSYELPEFGSDNLPYFKARKTHKFELLRLEALAYFSKNAKVWKTLGNDIFKWCKNNKLPVPTGSCADTGLDLFRKLSKLSELEAAISKCRSYSQFKSMIASFRFDLCEAKLTAVPKDYKSSRLIATIPVCAQAIGIVVQKIMMDKLNRTMSQKKPYKGIAICQENQEYSRQFSQLGSATNLIDTIDQSHASDMVTFTMMSGIIPYSWDLHFWLVDIVPRYARYCVNPEAKKEDRTWKLVRMETFAPAGYANTFNMECFFFAMVSAVSVRLREILADDTDSLIEWNQQIGENYFIVIVGDDIACWWVYTETLMDALTNFGLIVNPTKSFTRLTNDTSFREACGGEYCMGMDVTPIYFPRKKWDFVYGVRLGTEDFTSEKPNEQVSTFTSMCALARRLYAYPLAQDIVVNALLSIKALRSNMTISDDIEEVGIRSKTMLVLDYYTDHYGKIVQSQDGETTIEELPTPQNVEKERRFRTPKIIPGKRAAYSQFRTHGKAELPMNEVEMFDRYLYETYLCYGPDDSDKLLSELGVTIRREL